MDSQLGIKLAVIAGIVWALWFGLSTGTMPAPRVWPGRDDAPFLFWFAGGLYALLLVVMLGSLIGLW